MQIVMSWEMFFNQLQKDFAYICFYIHGIWWIEPYNFTFAFAFHISMVVSSLHAETTRGIIYIYIYILKYINRLNNKRFLLTP